MLLDIIKSDHLEARKAKNTVAANVLGTIIAALETNTKSTAPKPEMEIVQTIAKKVSETIDVLNSHPERTNQLEKYQEELAQIVKYLPKQLTNDELKKIIEDQHVEGNNMGKIMAHLKANYNGRYDAKNASDIVRSLVNA